MSAVAKQRETNNEDPAVVAGNISGSGSLRAPQPRERVNMTAVEARADGVALLVVEWQGADSAGQKRLGSLIIRLLQPTLKRVAARFTVTARGSLATEDLEQVAAIEAFKFLSKYKHADAGSTTFEQHVYRRALRACAHQIETQRADVLPSRNAQRYPDLIKKKVLGEVRVESIDDESWSRTSSSDTGFTGESRLGQAAFSMPSNGAVDGVATPEQMLSDAQTRRELSLALARLPSAKREIIKEAFGVGTHDTSSSLRDMARRRRVPRSRLAADLDDALSELRSQIDA